MLVPLCMTGAWGSSLAPANATIIAGTWRIVLEGQGQACMLHLARDGAAAGDPAGCEVKALGRVGVVRWRSKPDGLALVDGEGRTQLFLSPIPGGRYQGYTRQEASVVLERLAP